MESGPERRVKWVLVAAVSFLAVHRVFLGALRDFDPDELQHMHGAYAMASGLRAHLDYFEHHTPWFAGAISQVVSLLGSSWNTLIVVRMVMWAFSTAAALALGVLVHRACRPYLSPVRAEGAAWMAVLLNLSILTGTDKAIEIRPDVPATFGFVFALTCILDALRSSRAGGAWLGHAAAGGLSLGCALMLTPKFAFGAIGIGVGALWFLLATSAKAGGWRALLAFVATSTVPAAGTAAWLGTRGQLEGFIRDAVLGPLDWPREIGAEVHLKLALQSSPLHLIIGALGLAHFLGAASSRRGARPRDPAFFLLPAAAIAILVGWFTVPVPWPQFLLPLWPLLAAGGAIYLTSMDEHPRGWRLGLSIVAGVMGMALFLGQPFAWWAKTLEPAAWLLGAGWMGAAAMGRAGPLRMGLFALASAGLAFGVFRVQPHVLTYGVLWCLLVAGCALAPRSWRPAQSWLTAAVAVSLVPLGRLIEYRPMEGFKAEFDEIMGSTSESDTVLSGWRGCAVFRPHAYRYFFLHPGVLASLSEEERGVDVLRILAEHPPAAVIRDAGTRGLSDAVQAALDRDYRPSGVGDIWWRRAVK